MIQQNLRNRDQYAQPKMRLLLSYFMFKDPRIPILLQEAGAQVVVDSGAFSAYMQGKQLDLDAYRRFCSEIHGRVDGYFTLDVINDPLHTKSNHQYLRAHKLNPIAVWHHYDAEWAGFEEWLEGESWVSIGLAASLSMKTTPLFRERRVRSFLHRVNKLTDGKVKTHTLGWVPPFWDQVPCTSMDSSGWNKGVRHGNNFYIFTRSGRPVYFDVKGELKKGAEYTPAQKLVLKQWLPSVPLRPIRERFRFQGRKYMFADLLCMVSHLSRFQGKGVPDVYAATAEGFIWAWILLGMSSGLLDRKILQSILK